MKTRKQDPKKLKNKSFKLLKKDELIQIKGGDEDPQSGTDTQKEGDFD